MHDHSSCTKGISFIIPPYVLEHVANNTEEPEQRKHAIDNLSMQGQLRGMRIGISQFAFAGLDTGTKRRTIYDAQHKQGLPGKLVRSEGQAAGKDIAVKEAYDSSGNTYDFYQTMFKRNSINNKGMRLE